MNYETLLRKYENDIRNYIKWTFQMRLQREALENKVKQSWKKEEKWEKIKNLTGCVIENDEIIYNNRKDNEIFILRAENSNLKSQIAKNECEILQAQQHVAQLQKENIALKRENKKYAQGLFVNNNQQRFHSHSNININIHDINNSNLFINSNSNNSNANHSLGFHAKHCAGGSGNKTSWKKKRNIRFDSLNQWLNIDHDETSPPQGSKFGNPNASKSTRLKDIELSECTSKHNMFWSPYQKILSTFTPAKTGKYEGDTSKKCKYSNDTGAAAAKGNNSNHNHNYSIISPITHEIKVNKHKKQTTNVFKTTKAMCNNYSMYKNNKLNMKANTPTCSSTRGKTNLWVYYNHSIKNVNNNIKYFHEMSNRSLKNTTLANESISKNIKSIE